MFVDTHTHLHFPNFKDETGPIIERARKAGVSYFLNIGTDLKSSEEAVALAEQYDFVYATVGIHPHDASEATPEDMCQLAGLAKNPKVVAIGEVGLDFFRNLSPEAVQRKILIQFFDIAKQAGLPLILHIRDAYEAMLELLKAHFKPRVRGVCHCFSSSREMMEQFLALGLYISFAGPVTYKKNDSLRDAARACPSDRLLLETDAPYLPPQSLRGKRNEPAFMMETAALVAELKGVSLEALGAQTSENAGRLFGKKFGGN